MRFAAVLAVVLVIGSLAFASDPGQPLDCSDWVFSEGGHGCQALVAWPAPSSPYVDLGDGTTRVLDTGGRMLRVATVPAPGPQLCAGYTLLRTEILVYDGASENVVGYVDERCGPDTTSVDEIRFYGYDDSFPSRYPARLLFDPQHGRLLIPLNTQCHETSSGSGNVYCNYLDTTGPWLAAITGFATTFDILQTFTPQAALGFRVPYMPDGLPAADHFDTYWGPLSHPIDFTQAHALQCNYPAAVPHVGDYLTVADTVPTPAPGQGVYYVTAATYQGATRYGRKTTAGHLSGRDPTVLPACVAIVAAWGSRMDRSQIDSFSADVARKLKTYVYRLIDPRNGETFYVGKGQGNRVFSHIRAEQALEGDDLENKVRRIREIRLAGFEVAHVIHRHGMDDKTAFEVEAALIDAYPGLTNIAGGSGGSDFGVMHAKEIVRRYAAEPAKFEHKALLISVNRTAADSSLYEATRYAWKFSRSKATQAEVILSTVQGLIVGAFVADSWLPATSANFPGREDVPGRLGFVGREAPAEVGLLYVGKRVPDQYRKQGASNPIKYTWRN